MSSEQREPVISRADVVCAVGTELGEGPVWLEDQQMLWFVDILGNTLHAFLPTTGAHRSWPAPARPSFVLPVSSGHLLIGTREGLQEFRPESGIFSRYHAIEPHRPANRLNDACVGPDGSLWVGSMHEAELEPHGALYRFHNRRLEQLDSGYVVTNGPAFSPQGDIFYHTDSTNRLIYAFDVVHGRLSNKRRLLSIEPEAGFPDGTTVDAEGCLWIALWGGGALRRYSPQGELLGRVEFPTRYITNVAFGGTDLNTGYVTTARAPLTDSERGAQPDGGHLFAFRTSVPGLACRKLTLTDHR